MSNFVNVIKTCENFKGNGKKAVITEALKTLTGDDHTLCMLALNPYKVFGVKKFTPKTGFAEQDAPWSVAIECLEKLASRELTGNAARDAWADTLTHYTKETAGFLNRVLDKNLRAGFSADTYNKVWPEYKIPTFEVMLADVCKTAEDYEKRVTYPAWAAIKYDGNRSIVLVTKHGVEYRSREGKPTPHLNGLFDKEFMLMHEFLGHDFVADGEAFGSDFTETQNAKKEGNDAAKANIKFRLFFLIPMEHWDKQETDITMERNIENCMNVLNWVCHKWDDNDGPRKVLFEEGKIVNNFAEQTEYCNHVIDDLKHEGLIVKTLNGVYEWDRSFTWVKVKRMYTADLAIVGFYEGKKRTRLEGTLGGVVAAGYLEDGTFVITDIGSGFTDELRSDIWANKEEYRMCTIEVNYQEVTKAENKDVHSLRFGVFKHFRDDKVITFNDDDAGLILQR